MKFGPDIVIPKLRIIGRHSNTSFIGGNQPSQHEDLSLEPEHR